MFFIYFIVTLYVCFLLLSVMVKFCVFFVFITLFRYLGMPIFTNRSSVNKLILIDYGIEWDVKSKKLEVPEDGHFAEHGRGLMIVNAISDCFEHFRVHGKNITYCTISDGK